MPPSQVAPWQPPHGVVSLPDASSAIAEALCLPATLDLTGADALLGRLQDRFARDDALLIDGSAVEQISSACMQVLVAARVHACARGTPFRMKAMSPVLRDAAHDMGLLGALGVEEG